MDTANGERIDSWKEISAYLGRDVTQLSAGKRIKDFPFPASLVASGKEGVRLPARIGQMAFGARPNQRSQ